MIGKTLSHFRITAKIAEGAMGEVYLAEDTQLQRQVAIKVLPAAMTDDKEARDRFLQEVLAASSLDHANVLTVYEGGETEDGRMFLAMAYYGGGTLKEKIREGPVEVDEALRLAQQVSSGLARAHRSGIIHRDIKPANIVITEHSEAKIIDFGLAKLAEGAHLTRPGTAVGTPAYMSPEQVYGEQVDARTDLWSLMAVLYEMLTGRLPFPGGNESAVIYSILNEEPKPADRLGAPLRADVQQILSRGLAKKAEDRYQSAKELSDDLDRALRQGTERTMTMESQAVPRPTDRSRWPLAAIIAVVLAVLVYLGLRWMGASPPLDTAKIMHESTADQTAIAVLPFTVRGSAEYEYLSEGLVDLLSTKLDGAGELRSVDSHALLSHTSQEFDGMLDPAEALQIADHFGASLYLLGEVLEAGHRLHISATLYSTDQLEPLSRASQEGEADQIFDLLDQLTSELLAEQISGPSAQVNRTAALTTSSLPALKIYLQAEDLLRAGHFTEALTVFQEAVDLDPEFALAWYRLSVAAEWATRRDLSDQAATQAARLSDRLSDHYRQLLEARLTARRGNPIEAESKYRRILSSHPEDVEAWAQLSEVLSHHGYVTGLPQAASREPWEKVLELEPDYVMGLWHLARVAGSEGNGQELQEINQRIVALNPEADRLVETLALEAFGGHSLRDQQEILETLRGSTDTIVGVTIWSVALVYDDFEGTAALAQVLTEPSRSHEARRLGHSILVYMDLARGRWSDAQAGLEALTGISRAAALEHGGLLATLDLTPTTDSDIEKLLVELESWDASQEPAALVPTNFLAAHDEIRPQIRQYLIGVMEAQLGRESALARATELEALPGTDRARTLAQDLGRGIRARWLLSQDDPAGALRELNSLTFEAVSYQDTMSSPFLSLSPERYLKATLLVVMGEYERALPILSSFSETSFFDEVFVAPSHLLRGDALSGLGRSEEAARHYRRFIDLWQDCGLPLCAKVEEAQEKLAALALPVD